jgi:PAS domain S-box-containing protein
MHNPSKTYDELLAENASLKQKIRELEASAVEFQGVNVGLRQSEEKYRMLLSESPDPTFSFNAEGQYRYVNRAFAEGVGMTVEEIIGKRIWDVFPKEEADKRFAALSQVFRTGEQTVIEVCVPRVDGNRYYVTTITPVKDSNGKVLSAFCSSKDITDRKRVEKALQKSEANYRQLFDNSPTGIYQISFRTGKFLKANDIICEYLGCTQEGITALSPYDLLTAESKKLLLERLAKMSSGEKVTENPEYEIADKTGKLWWLQLNSKNFYDSEGLVGADVVAHDITERKRAEEALRETQRRLSDIIDFLPDATLVIDRDGRVMAWNRAMEAMTGVKAEGMLGKGNYEYALPFYGERRPVLIDLALHADPETEKTYTTIQRKGDTIIGEAYAHAPGDVHLSATASVLRDSKGEVIAAIECIRNNTDRKEMEERLQRAEKMESLGVLAGGVAHDLNNVLGVLVGYSELLLGEVPEGSLSAKYAKTILQGGERAAAIIQDLLTMARRGVSVSDTVNLNEIVAGSFKTPEFDLIKSRHPDVVFRSEVETDLFNIRGSLVHLSKTIMNLMSNAAESIRGAGVVTVRTENRYVDLPVSGYENTREGEYVVLTVTDTGSGISPADMGHIFEPFYTKKIMGRSGTGLGLAVVWGTVKDHGGYIDVHTEENKGTTFSLYFPVTRDALPKSHRTLSKSEYQGRGETILVVDDVAEQRSLAATILEGLSYKVATAASGEEAVECLKTNQADLIVLDMIMDPGIDGLDTYRQILNIHPRQKAIIVSGFARTERVSQAQALGAGEYVRKPYVIGTLGIAVRRELDRK